MPNKIHWPSGDSIRSKPGTKPPQPEPQPQPYKVIKQCQQVSKCNGCGTLFDKTDEKLYIFGRKELEWYRKVTTTTNQYKIGQRNTY